MSSIATTLQGRVVAFDAYRLLRRNLEKIAASSVLVAALWWRPEASQNFASGRWNIGAFYSAVFDWSSIQAAFLFGVYAFFLSRSEPFIKAIEASPVFQDLRRYIVRALFLTLALTVFSLPLLVAPLAITGGVWDWGYYVFAAFTVVLVYTFFCFLKVIRVFGKIDRAG